jgi:hypothetical protein
MTNQVPSKKFEPGVQKYLDEEESKEILQEYQSTTSIRGYKPPRKKFRSVEDHKPITTFSPEIWEKFGMSKDFNFVELAKEAGLVDQTGNVIIEDKPTTAFKKVWVLALIHIKAVKIFTKSYINPKSSISFDGEKYEFGSGDIKRFILHHFPQQEPQIRKLNATDVMKTLYTGFENNPCRGKQPIGILSIEKTEGLKQKRYFVDDILSLFSFDQVMQLLNTSGKRPHYTKRQYNELLDSVLEIKTSPKIESESINEPLDLTPDLNEDPGTDIITQEIDDSIPPAIEISPEKSEEIAVEQVINLNALKKILGHGDSITITIQYTRSSGE